MLRRFKKARNHSAKSESQEHNGSFIAKLNKDNSFVTSSKGNSRPASTRPLAAFHHDPNFSKLLPKEIKIDRERLFDENQTLKLKTSEFLDENVRLKSKLSLLLQYSNDTSAKVPKLKSKIRDLQKNLLSKEGEIADLKKNIRSSKLSEKENEIDSYIDETCRLKYLLETLFEQRNSIETEEYENRAEDYRMEFQALKKENIELNQAIFQIGRGLDGLKARLGTFGKKKKKKNLKKVLKELESEAAALKNSVKSGVEIFNVRESQLFEQILQERKIGSDLLINLQEFERIHNEQEVYIKECRKKIIISNSSSKRKFTLPVVQEIDSPMKLGNPPRLFVKINQILKKKKMLITVFLSLIDSKNTGVMSFDQFIKAILDYGKRVKNKDIQEVFQLIGISLPYVPLRHFEIFYEKYRYQPDFYSSSSEEEVNVLKRLTGNSPVRPQSPLKAREPEIKFEPRVIPVVDIKEIQHIIREIRFKMIAMSAEKNKIIKKIFGDSFDPDELMSIQDLSLEISESPLHLNHSDSSLLARFLIEPENTKTIKEDDLGKIKGCIRNVSKKLGKVIPDWEVFTENDEKNYEKFLKDTLTELQKQVLQKCQEVDRSDSEIIQLDLFFKILQQLDIVLNEKMQLWMQVKMYLRGHRDEIPYVEFLKSFEPEVINLIYSESNSESGSEKDLIDAEFLSNLYKQLAMKLQGYIDFYFPRENSEISQLDFLEILHRLGLEIPEKYLNSLFSEFSIENPLFPSKSISVHAFLSKLISFGLEPQEDYINEAFESDKESLPQSPSKDYIDEVLDKESSHNSLPSIKSSNEKLDSYSDSFTSNQNIEEAIHEQLANETELPFIEYGIKLGK